MGLEDMDANMRDNDGEDEDDEDDDLPMLVLSFHEGEYLGREPILTHLLDIAGSATRPGGPPLALFDEVSSLLEYWCEKYSSPVAIGGKITVFIGRDAGDGGHVEPIARLDIVVADGKARTTVVRSDCPSEDIGPVCVDEDDGVVTVVWKVLSAKGEQL